MQQLVLAILNDTAQPRADEAIGNRVAREVIGLTKCRADRTVSTLYRNRFNKSGNGAVPQSRHINPLLLSRQATASNDRTFWESFDWFVHAAPLQTAGRQPYGQMLPQHTAYLIQLDPNKLARIPGQLLVREFAAELIGP